MARDDLLILDAGGVLVSEAIPELFAELAVKTGLERREIEGFYHSWLRDRLWMGTLSEDGFWEMLMIRVGLEGSENEWRRRWRELLVPLDPIAKVPEWSQQVRIAVLSNHLSEWLRPILESSGVIESIDELWISAEIGAAKPDLEAYAPLAPLIASSRRVLFVDDQERNLAPALELGIPGLLADHAGLWVSEVERWLDGAELVCGELTTAPTAA